jgi:hypothetical protein
MRWLPFLLLAPAAWGAPGDPSRLAKMVATFPTPSFGFIDDVFALREDGGAIAYLVTDGADRTELHLATLPDGKHAVVPKVSPKTSSILWWSPTQVLLVAKDGDKVTAQSYDDKGPTRLKLGPVDDVVLSTVDEQPAVVTYAKTEKKGVEHTIFAYRRDDGKPIGKKTIKENGEGRVAQAGGPFKILWWREGYTSAATLKAGEFDKTRDMRRPDRFAHYDVWRGQLSNEKEIEDVMGFAQLTMLRKQHDNEPAFVHLSEDRRQLLLADGLDENEVKLGKPLYIYDANAYRCQLAEDRVFLAATIDPVNPAALEKKKAVPDDFELYEIDRSTREAKRVLMLPGDGRPVGWRVATRRVAILRKSKGFDRGGVTLEIYDL